MENLLFKCNLTNRSEFSDLGIEIQLDNILFFDQTLSPGSHHIVHALPETTAEHQLQIKLKNKTDKHTTISESGEILHDALIQISNITIDDINIDQIFSEQAVYNHNFNGNSEYVDSKFYGTMGCNGTVKLNFTTPFYVWLLEHM